MSLGQCSLDYDTIIFFASDDGQLIILYICIIVCVHPRLQRGQTTLIRFTESMIVKKLTLYNSNGMNNINKSTSNANIGIIIDNNRD